MKNRIMIVTLALFAGSVLLLPAAYAEGHGNTGDKIPCAHCPLGKSSGLRALFLNRVESLLNEEEIKLSEEKKAQILDLKLSTDKQLILLKAEISTIKMDLEAALQKEKLFMNSIYGFIDKKYETKKEIAVLYVDAIKSLEDIVSAK